MSRTRLDGRQKRFLEKMLLWVIPSQAFSELRPGIWDSLEVAVPALSQVSMNCLIPENLCLEPVEHLCDLL